MVENEIRKCVVDLAVQINSETGPGLQKTVDETILAPQLRQSGFQVEAQVAISIEYQGLRCDEGFRADRIVENKVVVEINGVETLSYAHKKTAAHIPGPYRDASWLPVELQRIPDEV